MGRKGENIYRRKDGRWEARYEKGRGANGRIVYGSIYGKSYREVKEKKRNILTKLPNRKGLSPSDSMSFSEISEKWLESIRYTVKESTYSCYRTLTYKHILSYFGKYSVITSAHIRDFIDAKITSGLSTATVRSIVVLLERILRYGEEEELLPLSKRKVVFPKHVFDIKDTLDDEQLSVLARYLYLEADSFATGILLCMYTGIRIGELCGLKGEDFDFANETFTIHRTLSRIRNTESLSDASASKTRVIISTPKSASSLRKIPIPHYLLPLLKRQQLSPDIFLLTGTTQYSEPRNLQRRFRTILEKCDLPQVTFHSLRHSFATRCIENGVDSKALSEILGHSSVKITLDIYVHSNLEQKREYINHLRI